MTGIVILAAALATAGAFAAYRAHVDGRFTPDHEPVGTTAWDVVATAVPGAQPGTRATLVQFSSAFCAPCRTTRVVLTDVAANEAGVSHVEVDAEEHLDLVRSLHVRRTPTTLVLDADGHEVLRASGAPRREQVLAALSAEPVSR